jgi:hypothetical protein
VGQACLAEISCADLVWKMRIVTFISSSFGQPLGRRFLYEHPFILLLPPVHYFPSGHPKRRLDHSQTHLIFPNSVPPLICHEPVFPCGASNFPCCREPFTSSQIHKDLPCQMTSLIPSWTGIPRAGSLYPIGACMEAASQYPFLVYLRLSSY